MQGLVASGCLAGQHLIIYTRARNGQGGVGVTPGKKGGSIGKAGETLRQAEKVDPQSGSDAQRVGRAAAAAGETPGKRREGIGRLVTEVT